MEVPNKNTPEEIMDFKKFAQSVKGLMFSDEKVMIEGVFKNKKTGKAVSGDNFKAFKVFKSGEQINAELIYKTYIEWFNYTLRTYETKRIFVSAKFGEDKR